MTKTVKYVLTAATLVLIGSTVGLFSSENLYSPISWFISANTLVISLALIHIKRTNSNRIFGGYLVALIMFYTWINSEPHLGIEYILYFGTEHFNQLSRTILTLLLFGFGAIQLFSGGRFVVLQTKKVFWASMILLSFFLVTEIPMYNIHGDFGGNPHGHNYINGFHFH